MQVQSVITYTMRGKDIDYVEDMHVPSQHWLLMLMESLDWFRSKLRQRSFSSSTDEPGSITR